MIRKVYSVRESIVFTVILLGCSALFFPRTFAQDKSSVEKANELLNDRDFDEAIEFLEENLQHSNDSSALYPLLGKAYAGKGGKFSSEKKYSDALSSYQSALKYSQDTTVYSGILSSYWYLKKDEEVLDLSFRLRDLFPNFDDPKWYIAEAYADKGYALEMNGKYAEAIPLFEQAMSARGQAMEEMICEIGDCYDQMNAWSRAIAAYKRACTDSLVSWRAITTLAAIYQKRNDDDSMCNVLQRGIDHYPAATPFWRNLLTYYERTNAKPQALECKKIMARLGDKLQKDNLSYADISYDTIDVTKFPWLNANFVTKIDSIMKSREEEKRSPNTEEVPLPTKQVTPEYPLFARKRGFEGIVWMKCLIGRRGDVRKAMVAKSDNEIFNEPAFKAAVQWQFRPALVDNKPISVWVTIPFRFKLNR
jgi:TonB family protein